MREIGLVKVPVQARDFERNDLIPLGVEHLPELVRQWLIYWVRLLDLCARRCLLQPIHELQFFGLAKSFHAQVLGA